MIAFRNAGALVRLKLIVWEALLLIAAAAAAFGLVGGSFLLFAAAFLLLFSTAKFAAAAALLRPRHASIAVAAWQLQTRADSCLV